MPNYIAIRKFNLATTEYSTMEARQLVMTHWGQEFGRRSNSILSKKVLNAAMLCRKRWWRRGGKTAVENAIKAWNRNVCLPTA